MAAVRGYFDLIIDAVPYEHDVNPDLPTLRFNDALVLVGYMGPLTTPVAAGALVFGQRSRSRSFIRSIAATQEMHDFCGVNDIVSDVEII